MELQQEIAFAKAEDMVGQVLTVMIEGKVADEEVYVGRTYRDAPGWTVICSYIPEGH